MSGSAIAPAMTALDVFRPPGSSWASSAFPYQPTVPQGKFSPGLPDAQAHQLTPIGAEQSPAPPRKCCGIGRRGTRRSFLGPTQPCRLGQKSHHLVATGPS